MHNDSPLVRSQPFKVVILEDGKYHRMGMTTELATSPDIEVVGASAQPDEIIEFVKKYQPDVAFIDLRIYGDMNAGASTIREIKALQPDVKCIVLTAFVDLSNFLAAFDAGAEGFIRKDALPDQQPLLPELVRIVTAGGRYYDPGIVSQMRQFLDPTRLPPQQFPVGNMENPLTNREREVLRELAKNKSNAEIADRLVISEHTVKAHISSIMTKLNVRDRREATLLAVAQGWLSFNDVPTE